MTDPSDPFWNLELDEAVALIERDEEDEAADIDIGGEV
jgi:hypothetical protein